MSPRTKKPFMEVRSVASWHEKLSRRSRLEEIGRRLYSLSLLWATHIVSYRRDIRHDASLVMYPLHL